MVSASFLVFALATGGNVLGGEEIVWEGKLSWGSMCEGEMCRDTSYTRETRFFWWRGGLVVGRRTSDLGVAGSRPGRDAAAQQP